MGISCTHLLLCTIALQIPSITLAVINNGAGPGSLETIVAPSENLRNPFGSGTEMVVTEEQEELYFKPQNSSSVTRNGIRNLRFRWPRAVVVFKIDPSPFSAKNRRVIFNAIAHIESRTCVRFRRWQPDDIDYVYITRLQGCNSNVGRVGGAQHLSLDNGCVSLSIVVHELVHAIGFFHEQQRYDRDEYVSVNWKNVAQGSESQFRKLTLNEVNTLGAPYDYNSVMHYSAYDFAADPSIPTLYIPGWPPLKFGNDRGLTAWDTEKINRMYRCQMRGRAHSSGYN